MTLDEAIEHAEERAYGNDQCAKDHTQLADWLRELRQARITIDLLKILRDGWMEDAQEYKAENSKLRELVRDMYTIIHKNNSWWDALYGDSHRFAARMRELGIEVG